MDAIWAAHGLRDVVLVSSPLPRPSQSPLASDHPKERIAGQAVFSPTDEYQTLDGSLRKGQKRVVRFW